MITVGDIRRAIRDLPDDAPVLPDWREGADPDDDEPGISIWDAQPGKDCLRIHVGLFYLNHDTVCEVCYLPARRLDDGTTEHLTEDEEDVDDAADNHHIAVIADENEEGENA